MQQLRRFSGLVLSVCVIVLSLGAPSFAYASSLTSLSDTMSRMKVSTASNHVIRFTTPTGVAVNKTVIITFSTSFNFTSKTIGTLSLSHGATTGLETVETLAASPSSSNWGAVFSGTNNSILTLTSPSSGTPVTAADKVILTYDNTNSINPGSANNYLITIGGTFGDTGTIAVATITDDQIPVTAAVDPSITFTLTTTTLALGTLTSAAVGSSAVTSNLAIGTNGANGYTVHVNDAGNGASPGLYNTTTNADLIASATATLSAGTEGYGGACNLVSGNGTCVFATGANAVTGFSLTPATFATYASKPSGNATYSVIVRAAVSSSTTAGTYQDTLTVTGTANF